MMAKPITALELYHPMIQFFKIIDLDNNNKEYIKNRKNLTIGNKENSRH